MNLGKILILLFIALRISSFNPLMAQTIRARANAFKNKLVGSKINLKNKLIRQTPVIVSLGVVNGHVAKPEDLVKPTYPSAARLFELSGKVAVQVLIDEEGKVIKAKVLSGHPLLRGSCLIAARQSKFIITTLRGSPVQVNGIITYIFVPSSFTWLEIGYTLQSEECGLLTSEQYSLKNLITLLPPDFEFEEQMLKMAIERWENKDSIFSSVRSSIEGKLSGKPKELWFFSLGVLLSKIEASFGDDEEERRNLLQQLNLVLQTAPENIKPSLIIRLRKLSNSLGKSALNEHNLETRSESRQALNEIIEKLSYVGR